jgi:hypothetical protein
MGSPEGRALTRRRALVVLALGIGWPLAMDKGV